MDRKEKMKIVWEKVYDTYLLALLITFNLLIGFFSWSYHDFSMVTALIIVTIVPIIVQVKRIIKHTQSERNANKN